MASRQYRIIQPWDWPRALRVQVKSPWWPFWRTLAVCGLSVEYAQKIVANHRQHGINAEVIATEPTQ